MIRTLLIASSRAAGSLGLPSNAGHFYDSCQRTVNHASGNFDINGTAVAQQRGKGSISSSLCGQRIVQCDRQKSQNTRCVAESRTI